MAKKRGFGQRRQLPSGRWQASYTGPDTAIHVCPYGTFETAEDAEGWLTDERRLIQSGRWTPPRARMEARKASPLLFGRYAEGWLESRELKPRTRSLYASLLRRFILPTWQDVPIPEITSAAVRAWFGQLDKHTPTQRAHSYALLRAILTTAVSDEIIQTNPCKVRGAGVTSRQRRIKPATLGELEAITKAMPERLQALIILAAWCSLRLGEVTELRRHDVDLERGTLSVARGVTRVDGEVVVGDPKTQSSIREVAIPPHLLPMLEAHMDKHCLPGPDALLFTSARDKAVQLHTNTLYRSFFPARKAAGRPDLRFHDLRHTGAVLAAQTGATLAELMARLGHSTPQAALRYQHAAQGRDAQIAAALSKMAGGRDDE